MKSFGKKQKAPKGKNSFEKGYVSFRADELQEQSSHETLNNEAYHYLNQAMRTSSQVRRGDIDIDDVYPVTLEECEEMDALLDKAEYAVEDRNDSRFYEYLAELRGIIIWSKERHWNFSWLTILGVIVTIIFLNSQSKDSEKDVMQAEQTLAKVEAWSKSDTSFVLETMKKKGSDEVLALYRQRMNGAKEYKTELVTNNVNNYYSYLKSADEYRKMADTAATVERKNLYLKRVQEAEDGAEKYKKKFDETNQLNFDEIKKMALAEAEQEVDAASESAGSLLFWTIFFIILIPFYIFAERPYGYTMTLHRTEAKVTKGLQKIGYAIAGGALAISYLPDYIVKWSDGSKTTESNEGNMIIMAIKAGLYILAAICICVISCILMIYSTATGLYRNYNWQPVITKVKSTFTKKNEQ